MKQGPGSGRAVSQLRRAEAELAKELATVRAAITALTRGGKRAGRGIHPAKRTMSPEGREAIARAARRRWAKWRKANGR